MGIEFIESDPYSPISYVYSMSKKLFSVKSLQTIEVWESPFFGRVMTCDDVVQVTEKDEHIYHEMLAHVPLYSHHSPESVLIVGGGDGGTLREVLKHEYVKKAVLVDIDPMVIDVAKDYFPNLSSGFSDNRVDVVIADGAAYIAESQEKFDTILIDSTDPVGPATTLYQKRFFMNASKALTNKGFFVIQSESLHFHLDIVREIQLNLTECFIQQDIYTAPIATYSGNWWSFSIASNSAFSRKPCRNVKLNHRFYDHDVHEASFLPFSLCRKLEIPVTALKQH